MLVSGKKLSPFAINFSRTLKDRSIVAPSASCVGFVRNYYKKLFGDSSLHHEMERIGNAVMNFLNSWSRFKG